MLRIDWWENRRKSTGSIPMGVEAGLNAVEALANGFQV